MARSLAMVGSATISLDGGITDKLHDLLIDCIAAYLHISPDAATQLLHVWKDRDITKS